MIQLVLSTDAAGFRHIATVLASILRRTAAPVHARVYTRGFEQRSFEVAGRLTVDFIGCEEEVSGKFPFHVSPAVFDRLRIIRDFSDWDRVLVLDHDMLVFCDLAEYFSESFDGNLLMGRLFGPGNTVGFQMRLRGGLPQGWEHGADIPYFYMGPMMNLAAMRNEGFWDKLLEAHCAIGEDEQISLTVASGGRIKGVNKKWNIVPQWDDLAKLQEQVSREGDVVGGLEWRGGVPAGLIHWTEWQKPWHYRSKVWRASLWDSESCGWEELRVGTWGKPLAIEIDPPDTWRFQALLTRGWRVNVSGECGPMRWPDLAAVDRPEPDGAEMVRFCAGSRPADILADWITLPDRLVVEGPRTIVEIGCLRASGYGGECRLVRTEWPAGGPHPRILTYNDPGEAFAIGDGEDLYLSRLPQDQVPPPAAISEPSVMEGGNSDPLHPFIQEHLLPAMRDAATIVALAPVEMTLAVADAMPGARLIAIHHETREYLRLQHRLGERATLLHAPIDPLLPWFDFRGIDLPSPDLLVVGGTSRLSPSSAFAGARSLFDKLPSGALLLFAGELPDGNRSPVDDWIEAGMELMAEAESVRLLRRTGIPHIPALNRDHAPTFDWASSRAYRLSIGNGEPSQAAPKPGPGEAPKIIHVPVPEPDSILWRDAKDMPTTGESDPQSLAVEVALKRALMAALEDFVASGEDHALVYRDHCTWADGFETWTSIALQSLPDDWGLVLLATAPGTTATPFGVHLARVMKTGGLSAAIWKRSGAIAALAALKEWGGGPDALMPALCSEIDVYCVFPSPALGRRETVCLDR